MNAFRMAGATDTGRVRTHNEDEIACDEQAGIALLADGMGGHAAGEIASRQAVSTALNALRQSADQPPPQRLRQAAQQAHAEVLEASQTSPRLHGMGTTFVGVLLVDDQIHYAHVGDSRLYLLRAGVLTALTRDHSLLQTFIDQGLYTPEEARSKVSRNILTHALGLEEELRLDVAASPARPGDRYLLCSDGLYEMLADEELAAVLLREPATPKVVHNLVELANIRGGQDNISVIVIDID